MCQPGRTTGVAVTRGGIVPRINTPVLPDWAFIYKGDGIPSFTGQAAGQSSGSGSQPAAVTAIISPPPPSGVYLVQGSLSLATQHVPWAPFTGLFSPL